MSIVDLKEARMHRAVLRQRTALVQDLADDYLHDPQDYRAESVIAAAVYVLSSVVVMTHQSGVDQMESALRRVREVARDLERDA